MLFALLRKMEHAFCCQENERIYLNQHTDHVKTTTFACLEILGYINRENEFSRRRSFSRTPGGHCGEKQSSFATLPSENHWTLLFTGRFFREIVYVHEEPHHTEDATNMDQYGHHQKRGEKARHRQDPPAVNCPQQSHHCYY